MATFYPIKQTIDGTINMGLTLNQAIALLHVIAHVRYSKDAIELTEELLDIGEQIRAVVGEEEYDVLKCIETTNDNDMREVEYFVLELTEETKQLVEEHKHHFLSRHNNPGVR